METNKKHFLKLDQDHIQWAVNYTATVFGMKAPKWDVMPEDSFEDPSVLGVFDDEQDMILLNSRYVQPGEGYWTQQVAAASWCTRMLWWERNKGADALYSDKSLDCGAVMAYSIYHFVPAHLQRVNDLEMLFTEEVFLSLKSHREEVEEYYTKYGQLTFTKYFVPDPPNVCNKCGREFGDHEVYFLESGNWGYTVCPFCKTAKYKDFLAHKCFQIK